MGLIATILLILLIMIIFQPRGCPHAYPKHEEDPKDYDRAMFLYYRDLP